jgi:hypothetical protein
MLSHYLVRNRGCVYCGARSVGPCPRRTAREAEQTLGPYDPVRALSGAVFGKRWREPEAEWRLEHTQVHEGTTGFVRFRVWAGERVVCEAKEVTTEMAARVVLEALVLGCGTSPREPHHPAGPDRPAG